MTKIIASKNEREAGEAKIVGRKKETKENIIKKRKREREIVNKLYGYVNRSTNASKMQKANMI